MTNPQRLLFLDFETYYDQEYSLTKMSPPNYILNPRFETIGCAAKEGLDGLTQWIDGPGFPSFIAQYDQRCTTTVTFNALFDNCILAWVYGFVPARVLCAMRMAVALRGHILPSASLASVTRCLKLGSKGTAIENVKGMRRAEIMNIPSLWNAFQSYAINDCDLCAKIFATLAPEFPTSERRVMDAVLRCAIEPKFHIDTEMLSQHLKDLEDDKIRMLRLANGANEEDLDEQGFVLHDEQAMFERMGDFASNLRSNDKFAALLEARGVDIEYKQSLSDPNREIPAFAKTDEFMSDLLEHEDPVVQALAAARLGVRSTIEQTRGARILSIAGLPWHCYRDGSPRLYSGGTMPIPLRYSGAHTHRLSGDWKINMQNLPAGRGKNKSKLRKALIAPPGHEVVVADLSQIECRITAWLCGETALLNTFVQDGDPYSVLAGKIFGFKVDKKVHLIERFIGKSGELGLGFGCGDKKFYNMVIRVARSLGMDVKKLLEVWTPELAKKAVDVYREDKRGTVAAWRTLDQILQTAWCGLSAPRRWGPVVIGHGYVELPNGMKMLYDVTSREPDDLRYRYGKREHRMYGPKLLENIVQALARIVVMNAALRIKDRGFLFKLQSHDELAFIVPTADVPRCMGIVLEEMRRRPSWAKELPLNAEAGHGPSYGDAK